MAKETAAVAKETALARTASVDSGVAAVNRQFQCPKWIKANAFEANVDEVTKERGEVKTIKEESPKASTDSKAWWSEPCGASKVCCAT